MSANDLQLAGDGAAGRASCGGALDSAAAWIRGVLLLSFALLLFSGCGRPAEERPDGKLVVITSFLPVYSFAANIVGDLAHVENLLPAGAGPHDYQFSPRDLRKLRQADLLLINGLGMEEWLSKAIRSAGGRGSRIQVIEISAGLDAELIRARTELKIDDDAPRSRARQHHDHHHDDDHLAPNPHIWLDPRLAMHAAGVILDALKKADPANAAGYEENAREYLARLERLDAELQEGFAPLKEAAIITYHDAFPYLARRYGLNVAGVIERVPELSPSARYLESLSKVIRDREVRVIFTETEFPSRLARQLAADLGVKLARLETLETGTLEASAYEDGMRRNLRVLREALSE